MPRLPRLIQPEFVYHVTSRGVDRRDIVRHDHDRRAFVDMLAGVVIERDWTLHSWVLMTNHLHLVVNTPARNLSDGMRDLLGTYAARFNHLNGRAGHLFQQRYDARAVQSEKHLLELTRYVPLNPVRAGIVSSPEQWLWSSYRAIAGLEPAPDWLEVDWTLRQFHPTDRAQAQIWYREFVNRAPEKKPIERLAEEFGPEALKKRGPSRKLFAVRARTELGLTYQAIADYLGITRAAIAKLCEVDKGV